MVYAACRQSVSGKDEDQDDDDYDDDAFHLLCFSNKYFAAGTDSFRGKITYFFRTFVHLDANSSRMGNGCSGTQT